jgi:hypothetical protein
MKARLSAAVVLAGLCAWLSAAPLPPARSAPQQIAPSPVHAAAGAAPVPDKGRFRILLDDKETGSEQFELSASGDAWVAKGDAVVRVPGSGETHSTGELRFSADGTPLHYEWTAQGDKKASGTVSFENGTAKTSINVGSAEPIHQDFKFTSPRVAVLDNNLYDQYAVLARLYDWNAKGTQTFPVLIPQDATPGSISIEPLGPKTIDSASLDGLRVRTSDIEVDAYFDARRRLMRVEVPDAKVVIVRQ